MNSDTESQLYTPGGIAVTLSAAERNLALLGLVDYEGAWEGLLAATAFVADGTAKRELIATRVQPLAAALTALTEHVDPLELITARHWFRHEPLQPAGTPQGEPVP